jgi:hypothetical protein
MYVQALTMLSNLVGISQETSSLETLRDSDEKRVGGLNFEVDFQVERDMIDSRSKVGGMLVTPKPKPKKVFGIQKMKSHSKEIRAMKDLTCKDEDFCRTLLEKADWALDKALNDFYSTQ